MLTDTIILIPRGFVKTFLKKRKKKTALLRAVIVSKLKKFFKTY